MTHINLTRYNVIQCFLRCGYNNQPSESQSSVNSNIRTCSPFHLHEMAIPKMLSLGILFISLLAGKVKSYFKVESALDNLNRKEKQTINIPPPQTKKKVTHNSYTIPICLLFVFTIQVIV